MSLKKGRGVHAKATIDAEVVEAIAKASIDDKEAAELLYSAERIASVAGVTTSTTDVPINDFDLKQPRGEALFTPPSFILEPMRTLLCDKRDDVMLQFYLNMLMVAVPLWLGLFFWPLLFPNSTLGVLFVTRPRTVGCVYLFLVYVFFLKSFNYMQHYSSHRPLFKPTPLGKFFAMIITHVFAPIIGVPPGMYRVHHIVMHHAENNIFPWDLSATHHYQRDSFKEFIGYWLRFWIGVHFQLPYVCLKRGGKEAMELFYTVVITSLVYFSTIYFTYQLNPVFSWYGLFLPHFMTCFLLMFGNWSQHLFVDPKRHESNYGHTYSCINNSHNQRSFNDGYHVLHHINASLHWSQLPVTFTNNFTKFVKEDSVVFEGIDYFMLAVIVFAQQWRFVAKFYKHIQPGPPPTTEEIIARLKSLCVPVPAKLPAPLDSTPMVLSKYF